MFLLIWLSHACKLHMSTAAISLANGSNHPIINQVRADKKEKSIWLIECLVQDPVLLFKKHKGK